MKEGRGGEEAEVEGPGEERAALELDGGVQDVREDDKAGGVGVGEGDEGSSAGHLSSRGGVDAPPDPAGG